MRSIVIAALIAAAGPAFAQGAVVSSPVELARQADKLKPGEWVWAPSIAPEGPVLVYVNLSTQRATVYRNGIRIGVTTVATGKPGHETPTGVFTILQKDPNHRSSIYNGAPMPNMQRLTWDGIALHAGNLPGFPASHGCVRMPLAFSKVLFGTTPMGGTVIVAGDAAEPNATPLAGVLAPALPGGAAADHMPLAPDEQWRWRPEKSTYGPVSIILSRADQRAVVLRNGVEIGRSRISIPTTESATDALVLAAGPDGRPHWLRTSVPGHGSAPGDAANPLQEIRAPDAFLTAVQPLLVAGVTVLVTNASVRPSNSGRVLQVLASQ